MVIPIIVKLLFSLAAIILLNILVKNLPLSLLGGTLVFALWIGVSPGDIVSIASRRVFNLSNLALICLVCLVIILSGQMRKTGLVQELVASVRGTFSPKASLAILPAVIGLLPMPGGALFSAPLLDNFDELSGIDQNKKTRINYWFRHVWEYAWPLYPGIILTSDISGLPLWKIFLAGLPISAAAIATGSLVFLSKIPREQSGERVKRHQNRHFSIVPFIPIITVVVIFFSIQFLFPSVSQANQYLPMVISLVVSITLVQFLRPLNWREWKGLLWSKRLFDMALIIVMIRIYGAFIETDLNGFSTVQLMTEEMRSFGIPTLPLIFLLPFIAGLTMGVSVGFVGAAVPVIVAMIGTDASTGLLLSTMAFTYVSGFMGSMLSPLHVCLIVTCDYYKSSFVGALRSIILPGIIMVSFGIGYMYLLRLIIP